MSKSIVSRRTLLKSGTASLAGLSVLRIVGPASAFQNSGGEVIPWLDQPEENPVPEIIVKQITWEELDEWITPTDDFFVINNFGIEPALSESDWSLEISGLVDTPLTLTLADLQGRERHEVTATIECSGNSGLPFLTGAIGN
ncbi:MAG: molybdopterin-dependent oxidoreductase, partial [Thermomicrobiales bacterium]